MSNFPLNDGHGLVGKREQPFTRLLPPRAALPYDLKKLSELASQMNADSEEFDDGRDSEENLFVPAGYTYLGQFVDHDLTFDTTSSLKSLKEQPNQQGPTNLRTPKFDLDCLYGAGPADQPYMYDGAKLLFDKTKDGGGKDDLVRIGPKGKERAVIGDKRNDENSIVCQIQLAFIKFHNTVVDYLGKSNFQGDLFEQARNEVRWTYQKVLVEDYLRRIIEPVTYDFFDQQRRSIGEQAYQLFRAEQRGNIPIEFSGAAYRFGHSMVRQGYRLNKDTGKDIFKPTDQNQDDSLIGFGPLPSNHVIDDWRRFFANNSLPPGARPLENKDPIGYKKTDVRLQWAYKIDPTMANPLANLPNPIAASSAFPAPFQDELPSLSRFNLFRGNKFGIQSGQDFAKVIGATPLDSKYFCTKVKNKDGTFTFKPIDDYFLSDTPLWFYMLAEAQVPIVDFWLSNEKNDLVEEDFFKGPCAGAQLGAVGGRILLEVFYGLMDADPDSFCAAERNAWKPMVSAGGKPCTFWSILEFANLV
jgi:hypothetical protein